MKKLLIIGGGGFIGSHLAKKASNDFEVYSLSKNPLPEDRKIPSVNYLYCDLDNKDQLSYLLDIDFSYVVNLGGYINHSKFSLSGFEVINTHFMGLINILSTLDISSIETFINIGTSDQYWGNDSPMKEDFTGTPFSCYSFSKKIAGEFINYLNSFENFSGVNVRLFLVYGPYQSMERFIPQIINSCIDGKSFDVSPGEQIRDFCYIDDVVDGLMMILNSNKAHGQTFNLASGRPIKIKEVVDLVVDKLGKGNPNFGGLPYRQDEQMSLYADISKAQSILGWSPKINLSEGLSRTIKSYK